MDELRPDGAVLAEHEAVSRNVADLGVEPPCACVVRAGYRELAYAQVINLGAGITLRAHKLRSSYIILILTCIRINIRMIV